MERGAEAGDCRCSVAPGAIVANVARRADVCAGQIYRWRQELRCTGGGFSEVVLAAIEDRGSYHAAPGPAPAIEVEFGGAARGNPPGKAA